jgi:hypothetical protein
MDKAKNSPIVIILFAVAVLGLIVSAGLSYEDYISSYNGYMALPTRKATEAIYFLAALVPQIGQIIFGWDFLKDKDGRKPWKFLIVFVLHLVDVGTDVWFKANGMGAGVWFLAFLESEALFTLGSEVLLVTSFSMAADLFASFIAQTSKLIGNIGKALDGGGSGGGHDKGGSFGPSGPGSGNNHQPKHQSQPQNHPKMSGPRPQHVPEGKQGRQARMSMSQNRNGGNQRPNVFSDPDEPGWTEFNG